MQINSDWQKPRRFALRLLPAGYLRRSLSRVKIMDKTILPIIQSVAQKIVDDEHSFFIEDSLDNSEHIPKIKRIANSVNKFLKDHGVSKKTVI